MGHAKRVTQTEKLRNPAISELFWHAMRDPLLADAACPRHADPETAVRFARALSELVSNHSFTGKSKYSGNPDGLPLYLARHEGFEPPAFWSVASLQASKGRFSAISAPFVPRFRRFSEAVSHPLLSANFLSWVRLWVRPQQDASPAVKQNLPRLNQRES